MKLSIDEHIARVKKAFWKTEPYSSASEELAELADLLKELKELRRSRKWTPVEWHTITEEEREREGYPEDWTVYLDCQMPEDEQEILITVRDSKGRLWVEKDMCCIDDGWYLDSGYSWIDDVVAWMPLPAAYKAQREAQE